MVLSLGNSKCNASGTVLCCARLGSVAVGELDWIKRVEKGKLREEISTTERSAIKDYEDMKAKAGKLP
jgi:hypothetical protein